jgi:hypothetical protein
MDIGRLHILVVDDVTRRGLVLGFVFGATALAAGGASLRWLDGAALRAGVAVFALFLWGPILSVVSATSSMSGGQIEQAFDCRCDFPLAHPRA